MEYEDTILQLCEVIKESENNAQIIYDNTEIIEKIVLSLWNKTAKYHSKIQ